MRGGLERCGRASRDAKTGTRPKTHSFNDHHRARWHERAVFRSASAVCQHPRVRHPDCFNGRRTATTSAWTCHERTSRSMARASGARRNSTSRSIKAAITRSHRFAGQNGRRPEGCRRRRCPASHFWKSSDLLRSGQYREARRYGRQVHGRRRTAQAALKSPRDERAQCAWVSANSPRFFVVRPQARDFRLPVPSPP